MILASACLSLMPSLSAYHLTWVSLTMDMGYLLLVTAPDLGCEVALLGHCPYLECGVAPLGSVSAQSVAAATLLY